MVNLCRSDDGDVLKLLGRNLPQQALGPRKFEEGTSFEVGIPCSAGAGFVLIRMPPHVDRSVDERSISAGWFAWAVPLPSQRSGTGKPCRRGWLLCLRLGVLASILERSTRSSIASMPPRHLPAQRLQCWTSLRAARRFGRSASLWKVPGSWPQTKHSWCYARHAAKPWRNSGFDVPPALVHSWPHGDRSPAGSPATTAIMLHAASLSTLLGAGRLHARHVAGQRLAKRWPSCSSVASPWHRPRRRIPPPRTGKGEGRLTVQQGVL